MADKYKGKTIAVFGSAFNPPHNGHRDVIVQLVGQADAVFLVPSFRHAFGKQMWPFEQRLKLVTALADSVLAGVDVVVSDIERILAQARPSQLPIYTYNVLSALAKKYPQAELMFVVGPDNAQPQTWNRFYRAADITARWRLFAAKQRVSVRSTLIRQNLARGVMPTPEQCPVGVIELLRPLC